MAAALLGGGGIAAAAESAAEIPGEGRGQTSRRSLLVAPLGSAEAEYAAADGADSPSPRGATLAARVPRGSSSWAPSASEDGAPGSVSGSGGSGSAAAVGAEPEAVAEPRGEAVAGAAQGPAAPPPAAAPAPAARPPDPPDSGDLEEAARLEARLGFGGELRLGASVHQPALSVALSGDYSWRRASLGAGVEVNPYFAVGGGDAVAGTLHIFATGEHRVPLGRVVLRQRLNVGPAILLVDVLGHDRGSLGLFLEAVPLGVEIQTRARRVAVILEAFSLALSAPALGAGADGAAPLVRYQYRGAVGLRF